MELRNIEYFLTVAEEGSLRAAARQLGLTQPALTKAMRRLEDETGCALFDRQARGVSLTIYGESFRRHARALKASMAEDSAEIDALRSGTAGLVRIGAGPSWQGRAVPGAIRRMRQLRPRVAVQVIGGLDDALKDSLRRGKLDLVLAAVPEDQDDPDLDRRALVVDEYRVIADRGHELHQRPDAKLADILDYPWILPSPKAYLMRRLDLLMRTHGLSTPVPMVQTDIVPLKLELMRGSDYLSFHAIGHLQALGETRVKPLALEGASWKRSAGLIWRRGVEPNPAAASLINIIIAVCAQTASTRSAKIAS